MPRRRKAVPKKHRPRSDWAELGREIVQNLGPDEVTELFFGSVTDLDDGDLPPEPGQPGSVFATEDQRKDRWAHWRERVEPPHDPWYAYQRIDVGLSPKEAHRRAEEARAALVTEETGTCWWIKAKDTKGWWFFVTWEKDEVTA
jgi:hypothetical protein